MTGDKLEWATKIRRILIQTSRELRKRGESWLGVTTNFENSTMELELSNCVKSTYKLGYSRGSIRAFNMDKKEVASTAAKGTVDELLFPVALMNDFLVTMGKELLEGVEGITNIQKEERKLTCQLFGYDISVFCYIPDKNNSGVWRDKTKKLLGIRFASGEELENLSFKASELKHKAKDAVAGKLKALHASILKTEKTESEMGILGGYLKKRFPDIDFTYRLATLDELENEVYHTPGLMLELKDASILVQALDQKGCKTKYTMSLNGVAGEDSILMVEQLGKLASALKTLSPEVVRAQEFKTIRPVEASPSMGATVELA